MDIIECPHCGVSIQILAIACKIFRCGIYKKGMKQLPPHSSKEICDRVKKEDLIYGCGKPFKYDGKKVTICDYI